MTLGGVGRQLDILVGLEGVDGLYQADGADGDQILHPHPGIVEFLGDVHHQSQA